MKRKMEECEEEKTNTQTSHTEECHHVTLQQASYQLPEVWEHHHRASIKSHTAPFVAF